MKIITVVLIGVLLSGGVFTACKKHTTEPPQDTTHHTCDTCKTPCDTCNLNRDSLSHAFIWKEYTILSESNLSGVWVFGENDAYIIGASLWHFDGNKFDKIDIIDNTHHVPLNGGISGDHIFSFSRTDFWITSSGGEALHTTDGRYFDDYRFGPVNACWGTSSSDMYFVGNGGHIFHYDGTAFTEMASGTTKDLRSVWGTSSSDIWACGFNSQTAESILLHYRGNIWTSIDLSLLGKIGVGGDGIGAAWTCDSLFHKKVFVGGAYLYRETDAESWIRDSAQTGNALGDGSFVAMNFIRGNTASDYMVAGDWGLVSHWNGKTWKRFNEVYNAGSADYGTQSFHFRGNTACAVGFKDGQSWIAVGTRKQ